MGGRDMRDAVKARLKRAGNKTAENSHTGQNDRPKTRLRQATWLRRASPVNGAADLAISDSPIPECPNSRDRTRAGPHCGGLQPGAEVGDDVGQGLVVEVGLETFGHQRDAGGTDQLDVLAQDGDVLVLASQGDRMRGFAGQ